MHIALEAERWLSVEEIAFHLGVSKESIYRWAEKGKMPAHKVGRQWKFKTSEVDEWVSNGRAEETFSKTMKSKNKTEVHI